MNIESLIRTASQRLGMPENELRDALQRGDMSAIKRHLSGADSEALDRAMKDKNFTDSVIGKYTGKR